MTKATTNITNIGIIILAAGNSSRLGRPKQLLSYDGRTLLQHSLYTASGSDAHPIIVVLGAHADQIINEIGSANAHVVVNTDWQHGMASSIALGLKTFIDINPSAEGVILMVCDQPFVTSGLLNELITAHKKTGKRIIACNYENTFGPPAFFHHSLFEELLQLKGDVGARSVVKQHAEEVEVIPFPKGTIDIDTETDYKNLSGAKQQ
jgi:molybdenum cofactor cytidylyltransferase